MIVSASKVRFQFKLLILLTYFFACYADGETENGWLKIDSIQGSKSLVESKFVYSISDCFTNLRSKNWRKAWGYLPLSYRKRNTRDAFFNSCSKFKEWDLQEVEIVNAKPEYSLSGGGKSLVHVECIIRIVESYQGNTREAFYTDIWVVKDDHWSSTRPGITMLPPFAMAIWD